MTLLLMLLTGVAVLLFLATLLWYLSRIGKLLEAIGGRPTSLLAKLRLGLRAIETETAHLGPLLGPVNQDLSAVADGLSGANQNLEKTAAAASAQRGNR